jgi:hypothetical protein
VVQEMHPSAPLKIMVHCHQHMPLRKELEYACSDTNACLSVALCAWRASPDISQHSAQHTCFAFDILKEVIVFIIGFKLSIDGTMVIP